MIAAMETTTKVTSPCDSSCFAVTWFVICLTQFKKELFVCWLVGWSVCLSFRLSAPSVAPFDAKQMLGVVGMQRSGVSE